MVVGAVCPACKAEVREGSPACPRCGTGLSGAASPGGGGGAGERGALAVDADRRVPGDVPELRLPGPASSPRAARSSRSVLAAAPRSTAIDPNLIDADDLGGDADDVKLDLDLGTPRGPGGTNARAPGRAASQTHGAHGAAGEPRGDTPVRAAGAARAAPWGTETAALVTAPATDAAGGLDPFEVRAVADYGPRPRHWWETPRYAYRVLTRKAELGRAIALRKAEAERAETAAEDALIAFGQKARAVVDAMPASATSSSSAYGAALQAVGATEDLFRARDTALSAETQAHDQRRAEAEQQIGDMEAQVAARRAEEDAIAAELAAVEAVVKRAEARVKRAEIEIRNAGQLPAQGSPQAPESRRGSS